jgi:hypothetical protein
LNFLSELRNRPYFTQNTLRRVQSLQCGPAGAGEAAGRLCEADPGRVGGRSPRGGSPGSDGGVGPTDDGSGEPWRRRSGLRLPELAAVAWRRHLTAGDDGRRCRGTRGRRQTGRSALVGSGAGYRGSGGGYGVWRPAAREQNTTLVSLLCAQNDGDEGEARMARRCKARARRPGGGSTWARGWQGPRPGRGGAPRHSAGLGERGGVYQGARVHSGGAEASVRRGNARTTRGTREPSRAAGARARRRRLAGPARFHLPCFENA